MAPDETIMIMPIVTVEKAKAAWKQYQELFDAITEENDLQTIQGHIYKKKSFWQKASRFFGVSVTILEEKREEMPGKIMYSFKQRAVAQNGIYAEGTGTCDSVEMGKDFTEHKCRAKAETRSFNRAVSNLVGAGEASAEEAEVTAETTSNAQAVAAGAKAQPSWAVGICPKCKSTLAISKRDSSKYYCVNYDGKKNPQYGPCDVAGAIADLNKPAEGVA